MISLAKELAMRLERDGYSAAVINPRFVKLSIAKCLSSTRAASQPSSPSRSCEDGRLWLGRDRDSQRPGKRRSRRAHRLPDRFIEHGKVDDLRARHGVSLTKRWPSAATAGAPHAPCSGGS